MTLRGGSLERNSSSEAIEDQLRLIVNPFLAVFGWVIVLIIIRIGSQVYSVYLFLAGLGLLLVPCSCSNIIASIAAQQAAMLLEALLFRRHVTAAQNGIVRRYLRLSVKNQTIAWLYLLVVAFMVFAIVRASHR